MNKVAIRIMIPNLNTLTQQVTLKINRVEPAWAIYRDDNTS